MKPKSMKNRSRNSNKNYACKQGSKNRKNPKKWSEHGSKQKWRNFGGNAYWGAFGGPNRFRGEKVGPQRCQSAPKARKMSQKWHKRAPQVRKWAPKDNPFRSQAKMSSKSGPFSDPGPADCAKRLQLIGPAINAVIQLIAFLGNFRLINVIIG